MQARRPGAGDTRLRAAVPLICALICALAVSVGAFAHSQHVESHAAHHGVVLTAATADTPSTLLRGPAHGDLVAPPAVRSAPQPIATTSDSSSSANSRTALSSRVRGPPGQALA